MTETGSRPVATAIAAAPVHWRSSIEKRSAMSSRIRFASSCAPADMLVWISSWSSGLVASPVIEGHAGVEAAAPHSARGPWTHAMGLSPPGPAANAPRATATTHPPRPTAWGCRASGTATRASLRALPRSDGLGAWGPRCTGSPEPARSTRSGPSPPLRPISPPPVARRPRRGIPEGSRASRCGSSPTPAPPQTRRDRLRSRR